MAAESSAAVYSIRNVFILSQLFSLNNTPLRPALCLRDLVVLVHRLLRHGHQQLVGARRVDGSAKFMISA